MSHWNWVARHCRYTSRDWIRSNSKTRQVLYLMLNYVTYFIRTIAMFTSCSIFVGPLSWATGAALGVYLRLVWCIYIHTHTHTHTHTLVYLPDWSYTFNCTNLTMILVNKYPFSILSLKQCYLGLFLTYMTIYSRYEYVWGGILALSKLVNIIRSHPSITTSWRILLRAPWQLEFIGSARSSTHCGVSNNLK